MKNKYLLVPVLLGLCIILSSWGSTGHRKISNSSSLSFNSQMTDFLAWVTFLTDHSSDADYRKDTDPTEAAKHYIDIDNYSGFLANGTIPQTLDSAYSAYGSAFVMDNGILPWATERTFDSLRNCMQRHDFAKAQIFAADLGHYVGDGHMPLHITKNYDGQLTGNDGIHSRYESTMINGHISEFIYTGTDAEFIPNVNQYIFDYLYANYVYADSVLAADNYAVAQSPTYSSSTYKNALWAKTKGFTVPLFQHASHALAALIYTAWVQAGSPSLINTELVDPTAIGNANFGPCTPNPFGTQAHISFRLKENTKTILQVRDMSGLTVARLINDTLPAGNHTIEWSPASLPTGMYFLVLNTGKCIQVKKIVYEKE